MKYGFCFIDNRIILVKDLWKDGIHLIESGRIKTAYLNMGSAANGSVANCGINA